MNGESVVAQVLCSFCFFSSFFPCNFFLSFGEGRGVSFVCVCVCVCGGGVMFRVLFVDLDCCWLRVP